MSAYQGYPHSRTYLVFRQRDGSEEGVWRFVDETTISSTHSLADPEECAELAVRVVMGKKNLSGGRYAVVPKDRWELVDGFRPMIEAKKVVLAT